MEPVTDKQTYRDTLNQVLLLRVLAPEARAHLFDCAEVVFYDAGEVILREGEAGAAFFAVLDGSVAVEVRQPEKEVYIGTLGRGAVFGEAGLFLKGSRTATIRALDPSVVLRIDRGVWMDFLRSRPVEGNKALLAVVHGLLTKLRSVNQELAFERRSDASQADLDALVAELVNPS